MPMKLIVALLAAGIILAIILGIAYFSKELGFSALESIWDIGKWIEDMFKAK